MPKFSGQTHVTILHRLVEFLAGGLEASQCRSQHLRCVDGNSKKENSRTPPGADPSGTPFPEPSGLLLGEGAEVAQVSAILTPKLQDFTTAFNKKCCAGSFLQFTDLHGCICNEQGLTHSITCIQRRMSLGSRMVAWSHILGASAHFCHQCSLPNALKHRKSLAETGMLELTARNLQAPTDCHKQKSL